MPEVAHLRDDAGRLRGRAHRARLLQRVRHRLLHEHVDAAPRREDGRERVVVVGRGDEDRIERVAHLVEQLAVVGERARALHVRAVRKFLAEGPHAGELRGVGVDERHHALAEDRLKDRMDARAAADHRHAHLRALRDLPRAGLPERHAPDAEERQRANSRRARKKRPSRCIHNFDPFCSYEDGEILPNSARHFLYISIGFV